MDAVHAARFVIVCCESERILWVKFAKLKLADTDVLEGPRQNACYGDTPSLSHVVACER
jgi:hypothetical protein